MSLLSAAPGNVPRRVTLFMLVLAGLLVSALAATTQARAAVINDPPPAGRSVTAFPNRDFVSGAGYLDGHFYRVEVEHPASVGGGIVVSDRRIAPQGGLVEVNHPGGACWTGSTPDIRAGDIVRIVDEDTGEVDQTTVANVTTKRPVQTGPGTVEIHGTAMAADGTPLPVDQLEQRLIAPGDQFAKSGRRDLRATAAPGSNGRLAYDAAGSTSWTATYTNLTQADVDRALGAQSLGSWLGRNPAAATEGTTAEIGAGITGGPQAPCTAPKEILPPPLGADPEAPSVPANVKAVVSGANTVTLTWDASTDNVGVTSYGIYRNGQPIFDVQNPDGSPSPSTTFTDANLPPGTYTYSVDAADEIGNRSAQQATDPVTATANAAPAVAVNEPPLNGKKLIAFPSRDFAHVEGFAPDETGTVQIIRNGNIVASADDVIPTKAGVIEVNHPGGVCWNGTTPELRPGDVVRAITYGPDRSVRAIDQITVANVTAQKAVQTAADTVQIHGTAMGSDGKPLPIGELEHRLVSSSKDPFEKNGRRSMRTPNEGTMVYDKADNPLGVNWTATYTGLSAADVQRALRVESDVTWLGRDPVAGVELTIFETGMVDPPGPSPGFCSAPLEPADVTGPSAPTLTATAGTKDVKLDWTAATDDQYVYGYRVFKDGQPLLNLGADVRTFTDANVAPGTHTYSVTAYDSASPRGAGPTIIEQLQSGQGKPYGNLGTPSAEQSVTLLDTTAPSEPSNLTAKVNVPATGKPTVDLAWDASTDDVGVANYLVFRRPVQTPAATYTRIARIAGTAQSFKDTTVALSGQYEYTVSAQDAAGNTSTRAPRVAVTVAFDDVAPSTPTGVNALNWPDVHSKDVRLTWNAATDNVGVSRYGIYRDGTLLEEVSAATALNYTDANRPAGTYEYTVDAVDSTGNRSPQSALDRVTVANDPPQAGRDVGVFPARDFVSATGYPAGIYHFEVLRGRKVVSRSNNIAAVGGVVEVNHGGAPGCWNVNTPDIHGGDVVRIVGPDGVAEQTTTADVSSGRPIQTAAGTVVIHGTAADGQGNPIPAAQLENRLASVGASFAKNGRNTLRTGLDGSLSYDAAGSTKWTATYTGLSAADVTRALNADSLGVWLGRDPLAGNESTTAENSADVAGGPATPDCTAPLEPTAPLASNTPANLGFGQVNASGSATKTVTLSNSGSTPLTVKDAYIGGANFPAAFSIASNGCPATLAAGASCQIGVTFTPGGSLTARTASLNIATDAANLTSLSVKLTGTGFDPAAPTVTAPVHTVTQGDSITVGATTAASTLPVKVSWSGGTTATRYELEQSVAGGAFTSVALPSPGATSATVDLALDPGTVQFRVRAGRDLPDGTVAWSAYATGQKFTVTPTDSAQTGQISYGGTWTNLSIAGTFGGSVRWAQTSGDSMKGPKQTFSANSIAGVIADKGPNMGRMTVQLDGGALTTIDLYSSTVEKGGLVWVRTGIAAGDHSVTVRPTGTHNAASTSNRVEFDGLVSLR